MKATLLGAVVIQEQAGIINFISNKDKSWPYQGWNADHMMYEPAIMITGHPLLILSPVIRPQVLDILFQQTAAWRTTLDKKTQSQPHEIVSESQTRSRSPVG